MLKFDFQGKTVVVTGAGRGLGRSVARMFVKAGANVAYLSRTAYDDLQDEISQYDTRAIFDSVDVSNHDRVKQSIGKVYEQYGSVDILVNNAGIAISGKIEDIDQESWDSVMNTNVRSQFLCIQAVLPLMKDKKYGKIINVSSIAGRSKSLMSGCAYTTSKAAIIGLTRHVAAEVASFGINVNCICPSPHYTPMLKGVMTPEIEADLLKKIPLGYIAQPEQIANVILFLASDEANYITGAIYDINGGLL